MDRIEAEKLLDRKFTEFSMQLSEHIIQSINGSVKLALNGSIKGEIRESVKEVVNGKIDKLQTNFVEHRKEVSEHMEEDKKWKEKVAPLIETYQAATNLQRFVLTASKTSVTIVAGATATWAFFKFIVLAAIQK